MTTPNPEAVAWHQRGRELQLQGDAAAAEQAYRQALALEPLQRRSLNNLAVLLQRFEPQQAEQHQAIEGIAMGLLSGLQGLEQGVGFLQWAMAA